MCSQANEFLKLPMLCTGTHNINGPNTSKGKIYYN